MSAGAKPQPFPNFPQRGTPLISGLLLIHKSYSIEKVLLSKQTCTVQNMSNTELKVSLFPLKLHRKSIDFFDSFVFVRFFWGEKFAVGAIDLAKAPENAL